MLRAAGVLVKHIRCHTNERPFSCNECAIAFKTKSNLYKHCKSKAHLEKLQQLAAAGRLPLHTVLNIGPAATPADGAAPVSGDASASASANASALEASGAGQSLSSFPSSSSSSASAAFASSAPQADALLALSLGGVGQSAHVSAIAPALQSPPRPGACAVLAGSSFAQLPVDLHPRHVPVRCCCSPTATPSLTSLIDRSLPQCRRASVLRLSLRLRAYSRHSHSHSIRNRRRRRSAPRRTRSIH